MLLRQCVDVPKVVLVKATHNERAPGSHVFNILRKVCQQNIFVDVGHNEVELSFLLQEGGIAQFQLHLTYCIKFTIFGTVGGTPGIDIDSCNFGSTQFRRQDTQNAGAAAHIQHGFSFHFLLQQKGMTIEVVSWCPVPNDILGAMMISSGISGWAAWKGLRTMHLFSTTMG